MTLCEGMSPVGEDKPRVLIVDDHAASNLVLTLALRARGFTCLAVTSEAQAFEMLAAFRPDVVVLEWANRAERDVERVTRIRALARAVGGTVAVVIVTQEIAHPHAELLAGIDGYFTKPVALAKLEQSLVRVTAPIRDTRAG